MDRNDTGIPFHALLGAAALFLTAWLDGRFVGQLGGEPLAALTTAQIAQLAFGMLLLVYGVIGYLSVWFEGRELRPGRRPPARPGWGLLLAAGVLTLLLVLDAAIFARLVGEESRTAPGASALEGSLLAGLFFLVAGLLSIQKRYLMSREVLTEDFGDEVPW